MEIKSKRISIAIDGPAGAGKSTISEMLARQLGILHLDTGAMYRTVALKALKENVPTTDGQALANMLKDININVEFEDGKQLNLLGGIDVSDKLRTPEVSKGSSDVAVFPEVRLKMVELQREIASRMDIIMDGRDIGTYVLPGADIKIFLTASVEERAMRRLIQQKESNMPLQNIDDVKREIEYRDINDSTRKMAPLKKASDAHIIDSTNLSPDEVVNKIITLLKGKEGSI